MWADQIEGCCVCQNFYDLGNAHGVSRHKDLESFAKDLWSKGASVLNIATANSSQEKEREWLEACGFKLAVSNKTEGGFDEPGREVFLYTATYDDIKEKVTPILAEQRKKEEEERKKRAELVKKREEELKVKGFKKISVLEVSRMLKGKDRKYKTVQEFVREEYNIEDMNNFRIHWHSDSDIAKAINYRLSKRIIEEENGTKK